MNRFIGNYRYKVTINFNKDRLIEATGSELNELLKKEGNPKLDLRTMIVATKTESDEAQEFMYFNYLQLLSEILENKAKSGEFVVYHSYLEYGYMPVILYPSFFDNENFKKRLLGFFNSLNLKYQEVKGYTLWGKPMHNVTEIWVSKLDIRDKYNIPMKDITLKKLWSLKGGFWAWKEV